MVSSARARLPRGSLDRERILGTALELAQEIGLAEFTVPAVAARLNVGVTSIYWHVRNRDELVRLMAEWAVARLEGLLPSPGDWAPEQWRGYLSAYFTQQRSVFAEDDLLTDLTVMRVMKYRPSPLGYPGVEQVLRYLIAAGFPALDSWNLYSALSLYTQGFAVVERRSRVTGFPLDPVVQLEAVDEERTPIIAELLRTGETSMDLAGDVAFESGLHWLLDGAAARLGGTPGVPPKR